MKIYTSYYANLRKIPDDIVRISIAGKAPALTEVMMSFPDVFNKFDFSVDEHDGYTFREQKKFTSKFDDVYKIIDQENGDITTIVYDFSSLLGTTYIFHILQRR